MRSPASPHFLRSITALSVVLSFALTGCDGKKSNGNDNNSENISRRIHALGRLEPAGGIRSVTGIPGEQVKELFDGVKVNELVPADGILGVLAGYDLLETQLEALQRRKELTDTKREHELAIADAKVAQAEASLAQAKASELKLQLQADKIKALGVASELANKELQELEELRKKDKDLVTPHQIAKQKNQIDLAKEEHKIAHESYEDAVTAAKKAVTAAKAGLKAAEATRKLAGEGLESDAIEQEIKVAEETLKRNVLLAPFVEASAADIIESIKCKPNGCQPKESKKYVPYTVLKTFVREGESIARSPVFKLGDLSKMVCIAEVYEADAKDIKPPMDVEIESSALGKRTLKGKAIEKGSFVAPPGVSSRNPLAPADRSVVEVLIEIDENDIATAAELVGLQVTVKFEEKPKSEGGEEK